MSQHRISTQFSMALHVMALILSMSEVIVSIELSHMKRKYGFIKRFYYWRDDGLSKSSAETEIYIYLNRVYMKTERYKSDGFFTAIHAK